MRPDLETLLLLQNAPGYDADNVSVHLPRNCNNRSPKLLCLHPTLRYFQKHVASPKRSVDSLRLAIYRQHLVLPIIVDAPFCLQKILDLEVDAAASALIATLSIAVGHVDILAVLVDFACELW